MITERSVTSPHGNHLMKYEYWKSNGAWYWHLKAANGEVIAQGEAYESKYDVLHVISLVKGSGDAIVGRTKPTRPQKKVAPKA
jgi:uncharacterized protein YegP (UPF0339 family)